MIKVGKSAAPRVVFFPLHRIELVRLDSPDSNLPSPSRPFMTEAGLEPNSVLTRQLTAEVDAAGEQL